MNDQPDRSRISPPGYGPPPGWAPPPGDGPPPPGYGPSGHPAPGGYGQLGFGGHGPPPAVQQPPGGVVPLRPLGTGDVLRGALATVRLNPVPALLLPVGVLVGLELIGLFLPYLFGARAGSTGGLAGLTTVTSLTTLLSVLATAVLGGLLTIVVSRAVLGRPCGAGEAWTAVRRRLPGLIGLNVLIAVILFGVALVTFLPGFFVILAATISTGTGGSPGSGGFVLGAGLVLIGSVVGVWIAVMLSFSVAAYLLEGLTIGSALRRSRALVRGTWWRTFGILLVASLVVLVPGGLLTAAVGGFPAAPVTSVPPLAGQILPSLATSIVSAAAMVISALVLALLYLDQRIRRERFDLTLAGPRTNY